MDSDLRRWWVCTLRDRLKFHFKMALFIRRTKCLSEGFGIQRKVNWIKKKKKKHCSILALGGDL